MLAGVLLERFLWIPILPRVSGFHMSGTRPIAWFLCLIKPIATQKGSERSPKRRAQRLVTRVSQL